MFRQTLSSLDKMDPPVRHKTFFCFVFFFQIGSARFHFWFHPMVNDWMRILTCKGHVMHAGVSLRDNLVKTLGLFNLLNPSQYTV